MRRVFFAAKAIPEPLPIAEESAPPTLFGIIDRNVYRVMSGDYTPVFLPQRAVIGHVQLGSPPGIEALHGTPAGHIHRSIWTGFGLLAEVTSKRSSRKLRCTRHPPGSSQAVPELATPEDIFYMGNIQWNAEFHIIKHIAAAPDKSGRCIASGCRLALRCSAQRLCPWFPTDARPPRTGFSVQQPQGGSRRGRFFSSSSSASQLVFFGTGHVGGAG